MTDKYDDIINLPHFVSKDRLHMSPESRAAQFSPFAALTGYDDAVRETSRLTDRRIDLSDEDKESISDRLTFLQSRLGDNPIVNITYFQKDVHKAGGSYCTFTGSVKRLDEFQRVIIMTDGSKIPIDDIILVEGEIFVCNGDSFI